MREVAKVVGLLVASFAWVLYGPLFYHQIEIGKAAALKNQRGNFDATMQLSAVACADLDWWVTNVCQAYKPILTPPRHLIMHTDASSTIGWGDTLNGSACGGPWSAAEKKHHINFLELKAVLLALQSWESLVSGKHVCVMVDNQAAVSIINYMGSSHSEDHETMARTIWLWCIKNQVYLSAAHIAGSDIIEADFQSRSVDFSIEWKLNEHKL